MVKVRLGLRQFIKHIYFTFIKIIFLFIERSAISDGDNAWLEAVAGTRLDTVAWYVVRGTRYVVCSMWNVVRGTWYEAGKSSCDMTNLCTATLQPATTFDKPCIYIHQQPNVDPEP